ARSKVKLPPGHTPFKLPPESMGDFELAVIDGGPWVCEELSIGLQKRFTPLHVVDGVSYPDRDGKAGLRVEVLDPLGKWRLVDIPKSFLAQTAGTDVIELLLNSGLSLGDQGRDQVLALLLQS